MKESSRAVGGDATSVAGDGTEGAFSISLKFRVVATPTGWDDCLAGLPFGAVESLASAAPNVAVRERDEDARPDAAAADSTGTTATTPPLGGGVKTAVAAGSLASFAFVAVAVALRDRLAAFGAAAGGDMAVSGAAIDSGAGALRREGVATGCKTPEASVSLSESSIGMVEARCSSVDSMDRGSAFPFRLKTLVADPAKDHKRSPNVGI